MNNCVATYKQLDGKIPMACNGTYCIRNCCIPKYNSCCYDLSIIALVYVDMKIYNSP